MSERLTRLQLRAAQDREQWLELYETYRPYRIRRRLLALKDIWDGKTLLEVSRQRGISINTLVSWMDGYLQGGLQSLAQPVVRQPRCADKNAHLPAPIIHDRQNQRTGDLTLDV